MYSGTATLEAEADAEIIAKVGGEVRRILVEEGDRVKSGPAARGSRRSPASTAGRPDPRGARQGRTRFQSPGRAAPEGTGVRRRLRRPQVRPRQSARRQRPRFPEPFLQRDSRAVRRHRLRAAREARPGNRHRHQHVSRHGSHAAQGSGVRSGTRTRAPENRPGGVDQRRCPRRARLSRPS